MARGLRQVRNPRFLPGGDNAGSAIYTTRTRRFVITVWRAHSTSGRISRWDRSSLRRYLPADENIIAKGKYLVIVFYYVKSSLDSE